MQAAASELENVQVKQSMLIGTKYVIGLFDKGSIAITEDNFSYAPIPKAFDYHAACKRRLELRHDGRCPIVYTEREWLMLMEEKLKKEIESLKKLKI